MGNRYKNYIKNLQIQCGNNLSRGLRDWPSTLWVTGTINMGFAFYES